MVGRPNVGKSTLLNRVLGDKIAIVSNRPQTTRNRILGIRTWDDDQLMLVDTPGIHRRRAQLNRFMVREALESLDGVDIVLVMTEVQSEPRQEDGAICLHPLDDYVLEQVRLRQPQKPVVVAINKIDRLRDRALLLPVIAAWQDKGFSRVVPISALRSSGVDALLEELRGLLPQGPHLYPEDMITDRAERFLVAELIREQVFHNCRQELPYSTAVEVQEFQERPKRGDMIIEAIIHAERDSQKAILIGKRGAMLKAIGSAARKEMSRLLHCEVHLKLIVRVDRDWTQSSASRRRMGYE